MKIPTTQNMKINEKKTLIHYLKRNMKYTNENNILEFICLHFPFGLFLWYGKHLFAVFANKKKNGTQLTAPILFCSSNLLLSLVSVF